MVSAPAFALTLCAFPALDDPVTRVLIDDAARVVMRAAHGSNAASHSAW
jgi:hypothetical protein